MTVTAHALHGDADTLDQVVHHDTAELRLIANLSTPEADSLIEHLREFRRLGGTPAQCLAFQETIRRIAGHNGAALALADPLSRRLRDRATRARGQELNGGSRGWSVKRRAGELREPLRVLCDPAATTLEQELAASLVLAVAEKLSHDELLDPQVMRDLGLAKSRKLIELVAASSRSAETADNGLGARNHEGDRGSVC